jgi:CHAT domain-containing protein/tetratricopeptide (TPR) repeat protein
MNCFLRNWLVVTASLMLACLFVSPSLAQVAEAQKLDKQVWALMDAGRYAEAIPPAEREVAVYEQAGGSDPDGFGKAVSTLGQLYQIDGRYADAEPLLKRSIEIWEKADGPDAEIVASGLVILAEFYFTQGRYADAEPLDQRSLAIREKKSAPDDPYLAEAFDQLGILYYHEGRFAESEPLLKQAVAIDAKASGPYHVDVPLGSLANLYSMQGRYADAEPLYKRSLEVWQKAHGPDYPGVSPVLNNLALLYKDQRRYAEAEPLMKRALAVKEKTQGPDNPDLVTALDAVASLYLDQDRYADAEPLFKRSLAIAENAFGPDSPNVALLLTNLALTFSDQGRYADAEPLYKRALAIRERALGPDHPDVANSLEGLAYLYDKQARYGDAEALYKRSLAILEKAFGPDHPDVMLVADNLAYLYVEQARYAEALPLVRRTMLHMTVRTGNALPVLFGAQAQKLITADEALDAGLSAVQRVSQTSAGEALNALAVRFSAGNDRLAELVRKDQDLAGEQAVLDKSVIAAAAKEASQRNTAAEQKIKDHSAAIAQERNDLSKIFASEFPDYVALSKPEPLTVKDIQPLLADDEALVVVNLRDGKSYVWAITHNAADWKELAITAGDASKSVSALRGLLDFYNLKPFDTQASFDLYQKILAPVEDVIGGKPRLSFVLNGALTSLPPQLLVTRDPTGKALKDVDWLVRTHAVTVLPSVASLKVLRGKSAVAVAAKPLIGFADPVFDRDPQRLAQNARVAANVTAARGIRGTVADITELKTALPPLPDTADELKEVAASVNADPADVILGRNATESRVKQEKLDQFRIVYFATHGLLAGEVADFAKLNAEPALVLSLPDKPTDFDDGLLTASEVAQLKLNADWVVLSACNTASAEKPGAEALSGLARAFFYAGGRSLLVSNWEVETKSAVALMVGTFAALAAEPNLSHGEALQKSMVAAIENTQHPEWADPKFWAPFVVVGEPAKPAK